MAATGLRVCLLGPVQGVCNGAVVPVGGARRAGLLALLASRQPHSVSRAELVDGLWGDDPPQTAVNSIQVHISALRRAVGAEAIETHGDGYRLAGGATVDAVQFARELVRGQAELDRGEAHAAARTLRAALALWQGPALADVRGAPFADIEATRLESLRLTALSLRIEADLALGRHRDVVPELQALVAQEPLREEFRGTLMRALHRCGRQGEALGVYDEGRRLLREELGVEPSAGLRELHQRLLTQPDDESGAARTGMIHRALPNLLDETVGRLADLRSLEALLAADHSRLVTILGAGGVGKTRLSIELAHHVGRRYRDGVVFVPLAEAEKPTDVAATMCSALGIPAADDADGALLSALQARQTLVICDNVEHVTEAGPMLVSLLGAASGLQLLATSRQPLQLHAEQLYRLEPLGTEHSSTTPAPAVELFLRRARASDPTFEPNDHDRATIQEICYRCDGLPLAIELAAARVHLLGVAGLLDRLMDPLPILSAADNAVDERHRTLRGSIARSFHGLTPGVRKAVPLLSVHRGRLHPGCCRGCRESRRRPGDPVRPDVARPQPAAS